MIVDFHTHVFPDAIAERTMQRLQLNGTIPAFTDGTLKGLRQSMEQSGISHSVVLPVATKPSQFSSILSFAASIHGKDGIISFGGIHPDCEDCLGKLRRIREAGLPGIKLHPDYQNCPVDHPKMLTLIRGAIAENLLITLHAGPDIGCPERKYGSVARILRMLRAVYSDTAPQTPRIILAHTGGWKEWDSVERDLVGQPVYLDLSFSMGMIAQPQLLRILRAHGADRVLFATDSPWLDQTASVQWFSSLPLTGQEREKILWRNAAQLLQF